MTAPLDYLIHGAGGIGSVVAARLASTGRRVGLVARGAHLEALQTHGLTVVGDTTAQLDLPAASTPAALPLGASTVVILAMKTNDTAAALAVAGDLYQGLPVFCFQNGVANEDIVIEHGLRAYGCRVVLGGRILEPGIVAHTGNGVLSLGVWPTGHDDVVSSVSADLIAGGLQAPILDDIRSAKWGKVLANVNNAYLALTDTSLQASRRYAVHRHFLADVLEEALFEVEAAGIEPDMGRRSTPRAQLDRLREPDEWFHVEIPTDPAKLGRPSTWQDLHFQRGQVEVEYFNGAIVGLATAAGRRAPLNEALWRKCELAAAQRLLPGSESTESLRAEADLLDREKR